MLWKAKRRQELEKISSIEIRRHRAKILIKQLRRAAKKGRTTAVRDLSLCLSTSVPPIPLPRTSSESLLHL